MSFERPRRAQTVPTPVPTPSRKTATSRGVRSRRAHLMSLSSRSALAKPAVCEKTRKARGAYPGAGAERASLGSGSASVATSLATVCFGVLAVGTGGPIWDALEEVEKMADANKFSERLIDVAERFADAVDAAEGKGPRKSSNGARWLILPAAGAGIYALATSSSSMARQTRRLVRRAKDRATDLPDADLFNRVKEVTGLEEGGSSAAGSQTRRSTSANQTRASRPRKTQRRRKTTASR